MGGIGLEVRGSMVQGDLAADPGPAEEWVVDEVVVLAEADEDAAENPGHGDLGVEPFSPFGLAERGAASGLGPLVLGCDMRRCIRIGCGDGAEVVDEGDDLLLGVSEEEVGVDHEGAPA